mgnify:CR=1 FL=1
MAELIIPGAIKTMNHDRDGVVLWRCPHCKQLFTNKKLINHIKSCGKKNDEKYE